MASSEIRWQKFSNKKVCETLDKLVSMRNEIAHGRQPSVRKLTAIKWKGCVERLADRVDTIVATHVASRTGTDPW